LKLLLSDVLSDKAMKALEKYIELITSASDKFTQAVKLLNDVKSVSRDLLLYKLSRYSMRVVELNQL